MAKRRNSSVSVFPSSWTPGQFRVTSGGKIQVKVNPSKVQLGRKRNVAAGYMDEDGVFHPLRASYDYSRSRAGEKATRAKKTATKKRTRKKKR